ncbi:TetR-like C-terminal domain-containing protein [Kitasatospora sp. NPDC096077]|uniref:TetR-like C-terminal domain-containing protein n=1 Tax=Kitasatospora sp. NPDC096077 TaxID=3155544 RepID=UPI00331FE292
MPSSSAPPPPTSPSPPPPTPAPDRPSGRRLPGGPVLQDSVTAAIAAAFFEELAATGYARLSLEAVAKRAGAGKAAIYRRWASKLEMTVDLVTAVAVDASGPADTGTLRGDVLAFLTEVDAALRQPLPARIIPDLIAEGHRTPELAEALFTAVRDTRRGKAVELLERAVDRGELPADVDRGLALDLLAGPLYWRLAVVHTPTAPDHLDRLTDKLIAAFRA